MTKMITRLKYARRRRKSEVLGAQTELKSRDRFASLLSTDRVRVFESGTKNCRFTLSTLVRESGTF